jgi:hypothetical protein
LERARRSASRRDRSRDRACPRGSPWRPRAPPGPGPGPGRSREAAASRSASGVPSVSLFLSFFRRAKRGEPPPEGSLRVRSRRRLSRTRARRKRRHPPRPPRMRRRCARAPSRTPPPSPRAKEAARGGSKPPPSMPTRRTAGGRSPAAGRGRAAAPPRALDDDAHRLRAPRLMMPMTNPRPPPLRGRRGDRSRDEGAGGAEGPEDPAASSRIPLARPLLPRAVAGGGPTPRARERPRPARPARARRAPSGRARPSRPGVTRRDDDAVPNAAAATAGRATPRRARRRE